ncbi:MAG: SufS family cysteine desulfurase, partial [Verrucomicrobiales bacterium]|nr:SufS family cysteine desulfurase [Verrucomicrobiales bacterium]
INGKPLVYLDNGATAQKPRAVIDTLSRFFEQENANIHRGVHYLSMNATDAYDRARERIAAAIGAPQVKEVIFTRGTTEAINLVAHGLAETHFSKGDEIVLTLMEHHANFVPWQILEEKIGVVLKFAPVLENGELDLEAWKGLFSGKTKLATFTHVSNALGTVNPVQEMTKFAKETSEALVLVDGAQAVPHGDVDIAGIGCDFYMFSGHKVYGPDGIGILWGKEEILEGFPPYQSGGDMIERVSVSGTTFRGIPERFEAGTPNISGAIGLAAAFDYIENELGGWESAEAHEQDVVAFATERLLEIPGLQIRGTAPGKIGVISFTMDSAHPHDIGTILDSEGVAIRAGHHCAQPLMEHFGITGTARASFAFYNTKADADALVTAIEKVHRFFG